MALPVSAQLLTILPGMAYRCRHDADWTLEFASAGSHELLGYTVEELVDKRVVSLADLIHPDDLAAVSLGVEKALSTKDTFRLVYRVRTQSGGEKWVSETGHGVFDDEGSLVALEGFLIDITKQRRAMEALHQAQRHDATGRIAAGIAHDFNNYLMVTLSAASALEHEPGPASSSASVGTIVEAAAAMAKLTQKLMTVARPAKAPRRTVVDLAEFLRAQANLLNDLIGDGIDLRITCPEQAVQVVFDPGRFEHAIMNLVINARDAIGGDGQIDIVVSRAPNGDAVLNVSDNGHGMAPEVQARLFEPFFTTKEQGKGTGLGLAVVLEVVNELEGRIDVESTPGRGTTFRISLPGVEGAKSHTAEHGGVEVVLLVEDQQAVRNTLALPLRRWGYTVLEAADGRQALELVMRHKGPIHILVTDANMPHVGGIELAKRLRDKRPEVPRILITGDSVEPPEGLFVCTLRKPCTPRHVAEMLRRTLDATN